MINTAPLNPSSKHVQILLQAVKTYSIQQEDVEGKQETESINKVHFQVNTNPLVRQAYIHFCHLQIPDVLY